MKLSIFACSLLTAASIFSSTAFAQEASWLKSYQLEAAQEYTNAIKALDSIKANSYDAELKSLRRGWLYYLMQRYNESIREYRHAIERNSNSVDARLGITLPLMAQQRWREAALHANAALKLSPNNYNGLLRLTQAYEGQKDWQAMLKTSRRMVALYPANASSYVYYARAHAWLNHHSQAKAAYSAVLSRYPGHVEASNYLK